MAELGSHMTLVRIPRADHYFNGHIDDMKGALTDFFRGGPEGGVL